MFIQLITTKQHFGHHLKLSLREAAINILMCTLIQFALWSTNLCLCWNSQFASLLGGKWYCQNRIIYSTLRGGSETCFENLKNDVMVQTSQTFRVKVSSFVPLCCFSAKNASKVKSPFQAHPPSDWWCPGRSQCADQLSCWTTVSQSDHPSGTER